MMTDIGEEVAVGVQPDIKCDERDIAVNFPETATNLAKGLLVKYQPPLEQIKNDLDELTSKQEALIGRMQIENEKLSGTLEDIELNELFFTIKTYQGKLVMIKKDMTAIHERLCKLKKRALRLQQVKQKEALHKEQQHEQEIRREQQLIGKPSHLEHG